MKTDIKTLSPKEIKEQISSFDWNSMDKLYRPILNDGTIEQKEILAYEGYLSYLSQIAYDLICGKFPDAELIHFLDPIEKAESLLETKLWMQRGLSHFYIMEIDLKNKNLDAFFKNGTLAIEYFQKSIDQKDEDFEDNYNKMASIYENFAAELKVNQLKNWSLAIATLQEAIALNPLEAQWLLYIELLYSAYDIPSLRDLQKKEKILFDQLVENIKSENIFHLIAMAYFKHYEYLKFTKKDLSLFPEEDYLFYLEKALVKTPHKLTYFSAIEAGQYFHKEGLRLKRIDALEVAISYYQRTIGTQEDRFFGVRRLADIYEDMADIHQLNNNVPQANLALKKATSLFVENIEHVETEFSFALTYAEFLERGLTKDWYDAKPSISEAKKYAQLAERLGKGYNTTASAILTRLFLLENNEDEAIFTLIKELSLHDNCLNRFLGDFQYTAWPKFSGFVSEHLKFFAEVRNNYYDPQITWEELQKMSREEIFQYWEKRKTEIKNR